VGEDITVKVHR